VPGYKDKVEFGVLISFAYPVEGSGKRNDQKIIPIKYCFLMNVVFSIVFMSVLNRKISRGENVF